MVKLQKKVLRIIHDKPPRTHTNSLFLESEILKLPDIHPYFLCQFVHRNPSLFTSFGNSHSYTTRNTNNLRPVFQRLDLTQKSIYFAAPTIWNLVPVDIRNIENFDDFKKNLKNYFLSKYFT